jgi:hypothetical protein
MPSLSSLLANGLVVLLTASLLREAAGGAAPASAWPPRLETYLTKYVKLAPEARAKLLAGEPVTKLLEAEASKEVAIFGAVWVDAPITSYLAAVRDIERFESGDAFRVTKKISSPPRLEDFAQLTLPDEDVRDLRSCKVARCELKLSQEAIERLQREIQWTRPDAREQVNRILRDSAREYVTGYLEGGNDRLAVYRDRDRPTFVAREFVSLVDRLPALTELLPHVRRYLLEFPRATLPGSESFLYWQEADFGLKPTIRINHLVMTQAPGGAMVASKMLYASHYFWTALELRVLALDPARGAGFWFVTESRSRSDGLSGFVGRIVSNIVRSETEKGTAAVLKLTKNTLEGRR